MNRATVKRIYAVISSSQRCAPKCIAVFTKPPDKKELARVAKDHKEKNDYATVPQLEFIDVVCIDVPLQ